MRSFIDEQGKVAWIFDEKTHPRGLRESPAVIVESPKVVEVVKPKRRLFAK